MAAGGACCCFCLWGILFLSARLKQNEGSKKLKRALENLLSQ